MDMRVLLVEDGLIVTNAITRSLGEHYYAVDTAEDGAIGRECVDTAYDLILIDERLPLRFATFQNSRSKPRI